MAKERLSRSDSGVLALVRSFMKDGMGLTPKTIDLVLKRIRDGGEFAAMKNHMRGLGGNTYKRINQAIDMAEEDAAKMAKSSGKAKPEDTSEEDAPKDAPKAKPENDKDKKEVKEGKYTFMGHLLNEINVRAIAKDEVGLMSKEERVKRARMGDNQLQRQRTKELTDKSRGTPIQKKIVQLQQQIAILRQKEKDQGGEHGDENMGDA